MSNEQLTKDQFFERLGAIGDEMTAAYGKDFAMGALVLAARFIADGWSLKKLHRTILLSG